MCGIIGIFGSPNASLEVFQGLLTLQHRGQDSAGILSYECSEQRFHIKKDKGLVSSIFQKDDLSGLLGHMAIGHTRYSTVGKGERTETQPFIVNYPLGIGMAHNGNLVNYLELATFLREEKHVHGLTNNDLEAIINVFAQSLAGQLKRPNFSKKVSLEDISIAISSVYNSAKGGYSVVGLLANLGIFGFRDPLGIRPLCIGKRKLTVDEKSELSTRNYSIQNFEFSYCISSESAPIDFLGYEFIRDVKPGELVFINEMGELETKQIVPGKLTLCMLEYVYFAGAESIIENTSVYEARMKLGQLMGKLVREKIDKKEMKVDLVASVPETSRIAAMSLALEANLPYREALIKNRYVYRSFILKGQKQREEAVRLKLVPIQSIIKGKNVLLVDDSIVRGTTSKALVQMLKKSGANKVIFASTSPPLRYPCYYGVDFPDPEELIANGKNLEEIALFIEADEVLYLKKEDLVKALDHVNPCMACIDGNYPVPIKNADELKNQRKLERLMS